MASIGWFSTSTFSIVNDPVKDSHSTACLLTFGLGMRECSEKWFSGADHKTNLIAKLLVYLSGYMICFGFIFRQQKK
jgi:hypothetical protein